MNGTEDSNALADPQDEVDPFGTEPDEPSDPERIVYGKPANHWLNYVRDKTKTQREQRYQQEKKWFENLLMYRGMHYHSWNETERAMREPRVPSYRVRMVIQYTMASSEIATSKLLKNPPLKSVRAANASNEAIAKAKRAEQVLQYRYRTLKMQNRRRDAVKWAVVCGTGFLKHLWDPKAGMLWSEPGLQSPDGGEPEEHFFNMGDQRAVVCAPFNIETDEPPTSDLDACAWLRHKELRDLNQIKNMYPAFEKRLHADETLSLDNLVDSRFLALVDQNALGRAPRLDGKILVYELWERAWGLPPKERIKFPRGRRFLIAGDCLLEMDHGPNEEIEIPFVKYDFIVPPGQFWGISIPDINGSLNKAYDRAYSKWMENVALHCAPKWVSPKSAGLAQDAIDSEPAEVIEYNDGSAPPTQTTPPNLVGSGFFEGLQINLEAQKDTTGLQDVSRGSAPASASGVALTMLEEADNTRLGPVVRAMEIAEAESATMILKIDKQFVIEPRQIQVQGSGGWTDIEDFMGIDLVGSTDVEVEAGTGLPTSKATTRAMITEMWANGMLPKDKPEVAVKLMDVGVSESLVRENFADVELADEENRRMKRGVQQPVKDWHEDDIHMARLDLERKQGDFLQLDPMVQQLFEEHYQAHKKQKISKAVRDAKEQAELQTQIQAAQQQAAPPPPPQAQPPGQPPQSQGAPALGGQPPAGQPMPMPQPPQGGLPGPGAPPM